jgi:glycogen synthase
MTADRPLGQRGSRRILMTADTVGGVWTYALELARALQGHGVETVVATMGRAMTREQRKEAGSIPNLEVHEGAYKLEWMEEPWRDVAAAGDWLLKLEQRYHPDLIHLNGYVHGALPWRAPVIVVGHSCVLSWWRAVQGCPAPSEWAHYRDAVTAGLRAADLVVAPSQAMLAGLREHYGPLANARVIANGRSLPSLPLKPKEKMVLTAGRLWDQAKNLSALSAIAPALPWPVFAAGEPAQGASSNTQAEPIRLLGRLPSEELLSWLAGASIFVLPARYEPFGLSVLEAALAGCALVLGDIPSLRDIWGEAALFASPDKPEALLEALQELIANPARLAELAAKARRVASQFSSERMGSSYMLAYRQVLQKPKAAAAPEVLAA